MNFLVIVPSIHAKNHVNIEKYLENFAWHGQDYDVLVIDEDGERSSNLVNNSHVQWFGAVERKQWFKDQGLGDVDEVIPKKCHNENSFGLLYALEKKCYNMIVFADDDTYPVSRDVNFLKEHWKALNDKTIKRKNNKRTPWINTHPQLYVRGYPYAERGKGFKYESFGKAEDTVLNMGLWEGTPDLNACDYLQHKGFDRPKGIEPFALARNHFAPICSMNVAFKPEIIPAFYQLWFADRYDDIFSGLFLEKIASHLLKDITVGLPLVYHDKTTRNLFSDIRTELPGMELNENLWRALTNIRLTEDTWSKCYRQLASELDFYFRRTQQEAYVSVTAFHMKKWVDVCERLIV